MCTVFIAWQVHPIYDLIVCGNRDEFKSRPSRSAHYWEDSPQVFAGRDLKEGGTWMGVTKEGRFTVVTNYRDFSLHKEQAESRGGLTTAYLKGSETPVAYLEALLAAQNAYNPFNLLVADRETLGYMSNVSNEIKVLEGGFYGLSNALLNVPWPKVSYGLEVLSKSVRSSSTLQAIVDSCFEVLDSKALYADELLPATGVPIETERMLSAVFVDSENYGTQYQTVIVREKDGPIHFYERSWSPKDGWHYLAEAIGSKP